MATKSTLVIVFFLVSVLLHSESNSAVYGWWDTGHMLVAQISYTYISKGESNETQAALQNAFNALLTYYPESSTVVTSACWMDDLKKRGVYQFSNWHFINLPLCDDNITLCETISPTEMLEGGDNLVWAIKEAMTVIRSTAAGGFERGFALRNLIHLVGDMHQPLHCVDRFSTQTPLGDAGGNLFRIQKFPGDIVNLHALWDSGAGLFDNDLQRPLSNLNITYLENWAERIMTQLNTSEITDLSNITAWAEESIGLSAKYVYNLTYNSYPSDEYLQVAQQVILHQLGVAGYRLANLLKQIVWCNPSTNNCPMINPSVLPGPAPAPTIINHHIGYTITATVLSVALLASMVINALFVYKQRVLLCRKSPIYSEGISLLR